LCYRGLALKFISYIGSGIGLESALTFAERGSRAVVFADLVFDAAQAGSEKSKSIATAKDYDTFAIEVDVRDRASVKKCWQKSRASTAESIML
jgi:NAD(P)-dependent dehydrogenase (short-subunit alcohol dehydrogenase family)